MKGSRRLLESGGEDRSGLLRDAMDKAGDQALRAGQIMVEPNPGGGTIFRFTLRAASGEDFSDAA